MGSSCMIFLQSSAKINLLMCVVIDMLNEQPQSLLYTLLWKTLVIYEAPEVDLFFSLVILPIDKILLPPNYIVN